MSVSITQVSPSSTYAGPWVPVVLDVTTTNTTTYTYILATIGAQQVVVWGDGSWNPLFSSYSTRTELVAGKSYRYSLLPNGGWRVGFTLDAKAGEENVIPPGARMSQNFVGGYMQPPPSVAGTTCNFERTDAFSVVLWLKPGATSGQHGLICKIGSASSWRGWQICFISSRYLHFALYAPAPTGLYCTTNDALPDGWSFVAATYDGSSLDTGMKWWWGAVEKTCARSGGSISTSILSTAKALDMGIQVGTSYVAQSKLFEPMIFNGALSQSELESIRDAPSHDITGLAVYSKLRHHWQLGLSGWAEWAEDVSTNNVSLIGTSVAPGDLSAVDVP